MMDKIGEEFTGIITTVTGFGLFVELDKIYVEGLVHISNLPEDYFHFDAITRQLKGERTGKRFRLGDKIKIKVVRVDLDEKKIDFELVGLKKRKPKKDLPPPSKKYPSSNKKPSKGKDSKKKTTKFKKSTKKKKTKS